MFNVRLAVDQLYGKSLFTWLSLLMSLMVSYFVLSFSHEMSWMRSGTELSQFLRLFLPPLSIRKSCPISHASIQEVTTIVPLCHNGGKTWRCTHIPYKLTPLKQSGPQDQKSVTFSHSVISLNQLLKHPKTLLIFS